MTAVPDNITTVARQAVQAMVDGHIEVSVAADHRLDDRSQPGRAVGAVVSVELAGPDHGAHRGNRMVSAKGEASSWGTDEVVSAARSAAKSILESNPGWRRVQG
ncbi:MAG TPA: hypothetical protein VJ487_06145 [Alphaproteobacteria bacterium]|nr:hypothetical protein [Alphaproteobacteria bacterium]